MESHTLHSFVSGFCGITLSVSLIHTAVCTASSFFMAVYYSIVCVLIPYFCACYWFSGGSVLKKLPAVQEPQEMQVHFLGQEDPVEEGMATHSRILAWRIPWTAEPGGLQSMGS